MSKTYAVASAKGGVGKTTTTANLGVALARAGREVVVVDADIGMANLAGALGVEPEGATLHSVLAADAELADAIHEGPEGLAVLPGSPDLEDYRDADPTGLARLVADLAAEYEFVLLDTGAGLSHDTVLPLGVADEVVLVSTPQRDALVNTDKTRQLVDRFDGAVAGLVLTRAAADSDATDRVDADVLERVPDDSSVDEAIAAGEPIVLFAPETPAAAAYRRLTASLFDAEVSDSGDVDAERPADAPDETASPEESDSVDETASPEGADESAEPEAESPPAAAGEEMTDDGGTTAGADERASLDAEEHEADEAGVSGAEADETGVGVAGTDEAEADVAEATEAEAGETEGGEGIDTDGETDTEETEESEATGEDETDEATEERDSDATADGDAEAASTPRKSVGPRRDEDVPIAEAEGDEMPSEPPRSDVVNAGGDSPISEAEPEEAEEKKGFLRRLLGR